MPSRLHPGVYVEEVSGGARSIEAVSTSTAIFVGEAERGPLEPMKIRSFAEFERLYGGYLLTQNTRTELAYAVQGFFQNGGTAAYILRVTEDAAAAGSRTAGDATTARLEASSPGAWAGRLRAVFCPASAGNPQRFRIAVLLEDLATGTRRVVENWDRLSVDPADENYVVNVLQRSLYIRWAPGEPVARPEPLDPDDPATFPLVPRDADLLGLWDKGAFTGGVGGDAVVDPTRYNSVLQLLDTVTDASLLALPGKTGAYLDKGLQYVETRPLRDLFYVMDLPSEGGRTVEAALASTLATLGGMTKSDLAAAYWPWVQVSDPVGASNGATVTVPPSGHVAGLYARTDARRGVWKAPAGVEATVQGIQSLSYKLLDSHQDDMNPVGLNALRLVPSAGAVVWGARTLRPGSEWRYVSVRRTALFLRKSLFEGTQWAVFEPNGEALWASLRVTVEAFMEQLFRQGAFAGRTSRAAYFVKCDAETTRPEDQVAGTVNVWVGFAPLRPAEFVVIQLSQKVDQQA
jgi:uncharacterized protein